MGVNRQVVIVLGMHRSGTSALAGALNHAGIYFGNDEKFIEAEENKNDKGYYEYREIVLLDDQLLSSVNSSWDDYRKINPDAFRSKEIDEIKGRLLKLLEEDFSDSNLFGIKDPRMCRLLPIWSEVFEELGIAVKYIVMYRHPFEVCKSLQKRDGIGREKAYLLWLSYMLDIEEHTYDKPRTFVSYENLLSDWESVISRIDDELGLSLGVNTDSSASSNIAAFISDDLRHSVLSDEFENEQGIRWVKEIYQSVQNCAERGDTQELHQLFDRVRENYWEAMALFSVIIYEEGGVSEELTLLRKESAHLTNEFDRLSAAYKSKDMQFERYKYKRTLSGFIAIVIERFKIKIKKLWKNLTGQ